MNVPQTVADVLKNHVDFELECIDRMYLNVMVPCLQREGEVAAFWRFHRGHRFASSALMEPMSKDFVARTLRCAQQHQVPVVPFEQAPYKGRKKDDIAQEFIARQGAKEGVMFLGKALPHPFPAADRRAGYRYEPFIWQGEFSLTQVLDRPLSGRVFFEEVIRENLDLGRPDQVALIFGKRLTRRTPGWFRTRVLTQGVMAALHVDYFWNRIKQYFKEGRAGRTETTINHPKAFKLRKGLQSLPQWRQIGFQANRRLLDVQKISQDCALGEAAFEKVNQPIQVEERRVSGL